jgi:hypothetical protein
MAEGNMENRVLPDSWEYERFICEGCVGEKYLRAEVQRAGRDEQCSYCSKAGKTITVGELADKFVHVMEDHYQVTASEPNIFQRAAMNDSESNYDWERDGEPAANIFAFAADIPQDAADDVAEAWSERTSSADPSEMMDEDPDPYFEKKAPDDEQLRASWSKSRNSLLTKSRLFNREAERALASIFEGVTELVTRDGSPVVIDAGPGDRMPVLYRARTFHRGDSSLEAAITRPDIEIGPPPSAKATAGRMNARGISVFYGATDESVAIAEVRPPVGSRVVVARFEIARSLRLLDVEALQEVYDQGSVFDRGYRSRVEKAQFLKRLSREITIPVMPADEPSDYLITQAIADYLAGMTEPVIDGIVYPSIQNGGAGRNVALFHKSSRVEGMKIPRGVRFYAHAESGEEGDGPTSYSVWMDEPAETLDIDEGEPEPFGDLSSVTWHEDPDARTPSLRLDAASVKVHHIEGVSFVALAHKVPRHTTRTYRQR